MRPVKGDSSRWVRRKRDRITKETAAPTASCQRRCHTASRISSLRLGGRAAHHFLILLPSIIAIIFCRGLRTSHMRGAGRVRSGPEVWNCCSTTGAPWTGLVMWVFAVKSLVLELHDADGRSCDVLSCSWQTQFVVLVCSPMLQLLLESSNEGKRDLFNVISVCRYGPRKHRVKYAGREEMRPLLSMGRMHSNSMVS